MFMTVGHTVSRDRVVAYVRVIPVLRIAASIYETEHNTAVALGLK